MKRWRKVNLTVLGRQTMLIACYGTEQAAAPRTRVMTIFNFSAAHGPVGAGARKWFLAGWLLGLPPLAPYRQEAWEFILAGGGLFNHLDYSFVAGHERGDFAYPKTQPGGGSPALRRQLRILHKFINSFDFLKMQPAPSILKAGVPERGSVRALGQPGRAYAIYVKGGTQTALTLELPAGKYQCHWLNTSSGTVDKRDEVHHAGGAVVLTSPIYSDDTALGIVRQ